MSQLPPDSSVSFLSTLFSHSNTKSFFKKACDDHHLVYFGSVDQHSDEHEIVRGFTLSPSHKDSHFCVGTVTNRDVILLHRTDTLSFPGKGDAHYSWVILQIDLTTESLPHTVLDAGHYDEIFYDTLFAKFARLNKIDRESLRAIDATFAEKFTVYSPPDASESILQLLSVDTAATLGHHFKHFDVEWFQDRLIIYAPHPRMHSKLIDDMLRLGLWLSDQLEASAKTVF